MCPDRRKVSALPCEIAVICWLEFELCAIGRILLEGERSGQMGNQKDLFQQSHEN
jgi:hypothetical protein